MRSVSSPSRIKRLKEEVEQMKCVRCLNDTASKVADAPDGSGAWEVYYCTTCDYSWRNTEEDYVTDIEKRNPRFQVTPADLERMAKEAAEFK
jgi:late competence protein required for DNA uptake (superfamily II DNA/RNA helicase)